MLLWFHQRVTFEGFTIPLNIQSRQFWDHPLTISVPILIHASRSFQNIFYASWPDVLTSNMGSKIMVFWVTLRTSLGERFIHLRMEEPWDSLTASEMGTSDIWLRFSCQFSGFIEFCGLGQGIPTPSIRFNLLMFSEMSIWHSDTVSTGLFHFHYRLVSQNEKDARF